MDVIHRIITDPTGSSILDLGDSTNAQKGRLKYDHATDTFSIFVNAAERFTINSSGNITLSGTLTVNGVIVGSAANRISGLATIVNGVGILTLPTSSDTLVARTTTEALTNKTISLAANTFPGFVQGSILFQGGTTISQNNSNFFWDNTNARLGIATTIPATKLDVNGVITAHADVSSGLVFSSIGRASDNLSWNPIAYDNTGFISVGGISFSNTGITISVGSGLTNAISINTSGGVSVYSTLTANSVIVGSAANRISGLSTLVNGSGTFSLNSTGTITVPSTTDTLVGKATSDILTNKTLTLAGTNTFSGYTSGSVLFHNGTTISQNNSKFFWDNTNFRLGIGTVTPGYALDTSTGSIYGNGVVIGSSANTISGASTISGLTTIAWTVQTLTDGATINWNMALGGTANLSINGARTMAAPTNLQTGMTYILKVTQGTANSTITWNTIFKWPAGGAPVLSTTVGAIDLISLYYDGTILMGSYLRGMA